MTSRRIIITEAYGIHKILVKLRACANSGYQAFLPERRGCEATWFQAVTWFVSLRYGKPAVVDIMDIENMWPATKSKLDLVHKDLTAKLMSKALLSQEK